jgi:hypothetical protein
MALSVAEYLAQRTDVDTPSIYPTTLGERPAPMCPFVGTTCSKLDRTNPQQPVCTVRTPDGRPWIVCTNRLIPSKTNTITPYHTAVLGGVAEILFPGADPVDIGFKPQQGVTMDDGKRVVLDYVLRTREEQFHGRSKAILEIQGGGETNSTGFITRHLQVWAASRPRNNELLRQTVPQASPIPNNAWKRQLEQMFRKVPIALRFNAGFALVMGELLYNYVSGGLGASGDYSHEWEIALISIGETPSAQNGPLRIDRVVNSSFLSFDQFIHAVRNFPLPDEMVDPFAGDFRSLANEQLHF